MNNPIFGILNEQDSGMLLLSKLEGLERKQGPFEEVGIATLKAGRIRHQNQQQNWLNELQNQPLFGPIGIAYARSKSPQDEARHYRVELCANQELALVYRGILDNPGEIGEGLLEMGYPYLQTDGELVHNLISRYLLITGIEPLEAITIALARLKGRFAIMALVAEADYLIVARRGCSLAFSLHEEAYYFSSDPQALSTFSKKVIQLEEGSPAVLRLVKA